MDTVMETEQNVDSLQTSQPETRRELLLWLIDKLTVLAEAFREQLTDATLRIYAQDLSDLEKPQLEIAFKRALFPKIAELRERAGANAAVLCEVEAEAAWEYVNEYLEKWGVELLSTRAGNGSLLRSLILELIMPCVESAAFQR
jgi:hypothetical protein